MIIDSRVTISPAFKCIHARKARHAHGKKVDFSPKGQILEQSNLNLDLEHSVLRSIKGINHCLKMYPRRTSKPVSLALASEFRCERLPQSLDTTILCTSMSSIRLASSLLLSPKFFDFQDVNSRNRSAGKSGLRRRKEALFAAFHQCPIPISREPDMVALM